MGALGRIAQALGMRPAALVEPHVLPEVAVTRASERHSARIQWGSATFEPVGEPVQSCSVGAHLVTLPMGREPAVSHHHEGEEWAIVLSGVAEIRIETEVYVLREGDSLHFRAHRPHSYSNLASSPAILRMKKS